MKYTMPRADYNSLTAIPAASSSSAGSAVTRVMKVATVVTAVATIAAAWTGGRPTRLALEQPRLTAAAAVNDYASDLAACANYDDDDVFPGDCPSHDYANACESSSTAPGTGFFALCASACTGSNTTSFAMVCAWEAVARLPEVCDGSFSPTTPSNSSNRRNTVEAVVDDDDATDLTSCDEHAFCFSCGAGNAFCKAVAAHYGGVDGGQSGRRRAASSGGALAAYYALDDDLGYWCSDQTLAAVRAGEFPRP